MHANEAVRVKNDIPYTKPTRTDSEEASKKNDRSGGATMRVRNRVRVTDGTLAAGAESDRAAESLGLSSASPSIRLGSSVIFCLAASRDSRKHFSARETLRCRMPDPSASIAGNTAVSPWLAVIWEALSSSAAGCRAEGTSGVSLNRSELRGSKCITPPEADSTGAEEGSARTASTASRAVARRVARRACCCDVFVFRAAL